MLGSWLSSRTRSSPSSARQRRDRAPPMPHSSAGRHGTSRCTTSRPRRSRPKCSTSRTARQFTGSSDIIGGSDISVVEGSHVVVITAGAKQNPGQTRIELAGVNARILKSMMPQLLEVAPNAVYVIVTQSLRRADGARAGGHRPSAGAPLRLGHACSTPRACGGSSAERAGVSTSSVHAYIVGEHGDTEFPLWSAATIGTVPILEWETAGHPRMTQDELDQIADRRAGCRLQGHPGQGRDELRDRPVERPDRRGDPERRARGDAGVAGAARLPRRRRRRPVGAVDRERGRCGADPRDARSPRTSSSCSSARQRRCAKSPTRCADFDYAKYAARCRWPPRTGTSRPAGESDPRLRLRVHPGQLRASP